MIEARLTLHSSDCQLTLDRVICPLSVTFTALGPFRERDIKIEILLEWPGRVWGQEELPGWFEEGGDAGAGGMGELGKCWNSGG